MYGLGDQDLFVCLCLGLRGSTVWIFKRGGDIILVGLRHYAGGWEVERCDVM